jgi:hypothetical protein
MEGFVSTARRNSLRPFDEKSKSMYSQVASLEYIRLGWEIVDGGRSIIRLQNVFRQGDVSGVGYPTCQIPIDLRRKFS